MRDVECDEGGVPMGMGATLAAPAGFWTLFKRNLGNCSSQFCHLFIEVVNRVIIKIELDDYK